MPTFTFTDSLNKKMRDLLAWALIILPAIALTCVFGARGTGSRPLVPSLVPWFGLWFGVALALGQILYCLVFRLPKGLLIAVLVWIIAAPLIHYTGFARWSAEAMSGADRIVSGASCASALAVGILSLRRML